MNGMRGCSAYGALVMACWEGTRWRRCLLLGVGVGVGEISMMSKTCALDLCHCMAPTVLVEEVTLDLP